MEAVAVALPQLARKSAKFSKPSRSFSGRLSGSFARQSFDTWVPLPPTNLSSYSSHFVSTLSCP